MSSQQGPANRPWFRLASMMRPPPPPTTPAPPATTPQPEPVPVPRPSFIRPTFRAPAPAPSQEPTRPPPPQPSVASPASPLVATPPPPPVASAPPPLPVPSPAPTSPSPRIVAAAQSPRTVAAAQSPTVVTPAPTMPSPKVVTSVPRMPSPRIDAAAPPPTVTSSPRIVAAQPPPSPAEPLVPPTNGSSITNSPIKKEFLPSFSSPKPKISSLSSPSPPPKLASPSIVSLASSNGPPATIPRNTTPISSPKIVKQQGKTPPPSPSMKPFAHPPSPLTLPPAQIKSDALRETRSPPVFEQKTVLLQETREKQKASPKNFKGGQSYSPKHDITKEHGNHKKNLESEDFGMRIITIAGENKGAIMELSASRRSNEFGHIKRGSPRSWSDGEKSGSINGNIAKDLNQKAIPLPITAFTNSNVQGVNNSIVYNCSIAHHDPGVHLSLSKKPYGGNGIYLKDHSNGLHN